MGILVNSFGAVLPEVFAVVDLANREAETSECKVPGY